MWGGGRAPGGAAFLPGVSYDTLISMEAVRARSGEHTGEALRRLRLSRGLSQTEVATLANVSRPNLAAIESGSRRPSAAMTERVLVAIRGRPRLRLTPQVLYDIELSRVAAFNLIAAPGDGREEMQRRLRELAEKDDGGSRWWIERWADLLERWDIGEIVALLLSTDPEDVDMRKVSPVDALVSEDEALEAAVRARTVWRATR